MSAQRPTTRRDLIVAGSFGFVAAAMVGAAYAAVPFYNWFCRTTGYGGTTQVSEKAPGFMLDRTVQVRFDSNIAPGLPWKFTPEKTEITVHIGEVVTALYKVTNMAARPTAAQASYNVTPPTVGAYFNKINCFCFTQQKMKPGETREMAVVFYVDPSIVKDSEQDQLNTITLSYTFYSIPYEATPVADATDKPRNSGKL
jgi:cytochrome c oxidase assembly protein subunit 11